MFLIELRSIQARRRFPRARGDVPVRKLAEKEIGDVFPAHAGMFLMRDQPTPCPTGFPRARGDVP